MSGEVALVVHDCSTCTDCLHAGQRCCGCYDGACCQQEVTMRACEASA